MKTPSPELPGSESLELRAPRAPIPQRVSVSRHGMVATQHFRATEAGVRVLSEGGNAIDAAVAAALALCVCEPNACGLGGQTFMIIHRAKRRRTFVLDGSSFAPHRVIPGTLTRADCKTGHRAATVPTTPRVLDYALRTYGTIPWAVALEPAIELADRGFEVTELLRKLMRRKIRPLRAGTAAHFFLKKGHDAYRVGERLRQPVLAHTLRRLAVRGSDDFYHGRIARQIHADMVKHDGLIRRDDLAQVQPPLERRPVTCAWGDKRVMTMPPPGAGRTLIEMLNIMAHLPRKFRRLDNPVSALRIAYVMRQAYRDRRDRPYDPNYYNQVTNRTMTSIDYARRVAKAIKTAGETTHLSVMDRFGNVVGLTQSIERVFGSFCASEELGFLYNNYLMAYEYDDMSHPYYLRPAAVPWASVAPTIVFNGPTPWLVIGSPGSERITASVFQVLLRLNKQPPFEAVDAPRMYCDSEGKVSLEVSRMRDDIPALLENHGFTIDRRDPYSFYMGCVQLVIRESDRFVGVADPRRDGAAGGPKR